jgi:hypothetical protein
MIFQVALTLSLVIGASAVAAADQNIDPRPGSSPASPAPATERPFTPFTLPSPPAVPVPPAKLAYPQGILVEANGDLIVSDKDAAAIFRITPDKQVQLVAQWSPALRQQAAGPWVYSNFQGLLREKDGSLLSPDPSSRTLWRIAPGGAITKVLQDFRHFDLIQGICADAAGAVVLADPRLGLVKVADGKASFLVEIDMTKRLPLRNPRGVVCANDGSYVVADGSLRGVFRIAKDGTVTPIASGKPFKFPQGIAQDADGSFLVPDNYARAVFRVTPDGKVTPLVQGPPLKNPRNIAADGKGAYYLTDPGIPAILKIAGGKVETFVAISVPPAPVASRRPDPVIRPNPSPAPSPR